MEARLQLFSGSSNAALASQICECLGVPGGRATVGTFRDSETRIKLEEHVRGSDVFVVQTLCSPVNHHVMEMLLLVDAVRRCSASRVTAVIPYMAYGKQEKKTMGDREPISAKLLANIMTTAGVDRLLTVDLHTPGDRGFLRYPCRSSPGSPRCLRLASRGWTFQIQLWCHPIPEMLRGQTNCVSDWEALSPSYTGRESTAGMAKRWRLSATSRASQRSSLTT